MGDGVGALFDDHENDDPFWQQAGLIANAPPRPAKGYIICSLTWLARVLPVLRTSDRLAVAQLVYRQCLSCDAVRRSICPTTHSPSWGLGGRPSTEP